MGKGGSCRAHQLAQIPMGTLRFAHPTISKYFAINVKYKYILASPSPSLFRSNLTIPVYLLHFDTTEFQRRAP